MAIACEPVDGRARLAFGSVIVDRAVLTRRGARPALHTLYTVCGGVVVTAVAEARASQVVEYCIVRATAVAAAWARTPRHETRTVAMHRSINGLFA